MFFQTSTGNNVQKCPSDTTPKTQPAPDELMFELEDICEAKTNEVQELALDIVSKMVESWLDPTNIVQELPCSCRSDALSHIKGPNSVQKETNFDGGSKGNEKRPRCNTGDKIASRGPNPVTKEYLSLVSLHLPVILRLCFACPFRKVREKCRGILEVVRGKGLPVPSPRVMGPSSFVQFSELPFMGTCDEKTHTLFVDAFLQNNRLDHVSQVMGYHPSYLEQFLKTQHFILRGDGPLPFDYRHYIAIMAAGRHQCSYMIALQKHEFLLQGGDQNWLRGLKCVPQKLRNLYDINKILAHRPWLLRTSHIEKLTKCGNDSWSLAEVVHAIVILTHFHSLCSFVFSCGVNQELDHAGGYEYPGGLCPVSGSTVLSKSADVTGANMPEDRQEVDLTVGRQDWGEVVGACPPSPTEPEVGITTLMQRMKTLSEQTEECTPVELAKRFENIEVQSAELGVVGPEPQETPADISYFVDDPGFQYQDFAKRAESDIHTFRVQDYSWDDHGYSTVNRLYNDVGTLLDSKFKTAYNLTYYTMGGRTDVDTSRFRRAIWNYIQALLGIRHDDYDYGEINALVEKSLKSFIKTACCYPERVTKKVYDRVMREFRHSEKVHVNLMVLESRMQAELIYALRTVNRYQLYN
ncbi:sestrin homolog [Euwallacea similis]|uniref:sestrin homolog n=1 Tax=Euwallacea similis TaxID=1736056 RepID=UPI00344D1CC2